MVLDVVLYICPLTQGQDKEVGIIWVVTQKPLPLPNSFEYCNSFLTGALLHHELTPVKISSKSDNIIKSKYWFEIY